ncbi:Uncharacterised protein [Arcanobacterium haemolyticum]|uniref:hypothetical protein n=1 Tax=Arcanobacterium haemolyticum TaxID=28264 RepID=UPI000D83A3E1|nr:hypothetical protein [Arcanobacterium haemolyticum]SPT74782.1 Uncharacterised protein [Arcanobacterium haemolyticum]
MPCPSPWLGLPQIAELAGDANIRSGYLRFLKVSSLEGDAARDAFAKPAEEEGVEWSVDALERARYLTEGDGAQFSLGPTRSELINMGLLYTPRHGYAEFTVPYFDRFMLREIPELIVPEFRKRHAAE